MPQPSDFSGIRKGALSPNNPPLDAEISNTSFYIQLALTGIFMLVVTTLFEAGEELFFPNLEVWQSHVRTICFATGMAILSAFLVLRHSRRLASRALAEMGRRNLAERSLDANARFVARITDTIPAMIAYVDSGMRYRFVNKRCEQWFHRPLDQIIGRSVVELLNQDLFGKIREQVEAALHGQEVNCEIAYAEIDGSECHVRASFIPDYDEEGKVCGFFSQTVDITELKKIEENLRAKQEQLTDLAMELTLVEERERRNLAGELHDQVGQVLVLCKIKLNSLAGPMQGLVQVAQLEEVSNLLERAIQDIRSVSLQLSPPLLMVAGLEPALEWLGEQIKADYGLKIDFRGDGQPKPLREEMRTVIFQTVRELLINVAKHAEAHQATITVIRNGSEINVVVEDDGIGFDISAVSTRTGRSGGFGLFNIRQKIEYLGGKLLVESACGFGTRTTITASLQM